MLLLIHGYPFNTWDWAPLWDRLTARFTVVAPDMLGMGFSDKPVAYGYSVHDHADMHEALLVHLGVKSAHILAHDIGDSVGQELLARSVFSQQAYGALRIESITWLNGGLFNEAYTPRLLQKVLSRTPLGDFLSPLQGSGLSRRMIEPTINELFGPDTKPSRRMLDLFHEILEYNDGKRVTHKVGRFVNDRYAHRNRWVRAMRQTDVPMRLIDGPADPNSGRHMAQRYLEVIPNPDVVMLDDNIGHWPQIEAPDAVLENFLAHVDRLTAQR
jgi:pimeloyl-ACP methyl ester carboxylesterase